MADAFLPTLTYGTTPGITESFDSPEPPIGPRSLFYVEGFGYGGREDVFESDPGFGTSGAGFRLLTFFDDWYFRVHLVPSIVDFGSFSEETTKNMLVWNAWPTGINLTSTEFVTGTFEITYTGGANPVHYSGLQARTIGFVAARNGPEQITESFLFGFDTGEELNLGLIGLRVFPPEAILWDFMPNWASPFRISYSHKTDIITSRNGREQRRRLRNMPRKSLEFDAVVPPSRLREFRKLISRGRMGTYLMPELTRSVLTTIEVTNSLTITVASIPQYVVPDAFVVLRNRKQIEKRQVKAIVGNEIEFWTLDGKTWPVGTKVHPGLVVEVPDASTTTRLTSTVNTMRVALEVVPGSEPPETPPAATEFFDGRELFNFRPNWAQSQQAVLVRPSELLDFEMGVRTRSFPDETPSYRLTQTFVRKNQDAFETIKAFFDRQAGRQGEFYLPTWEDDLTAAVRLEPDAEHQWLRTTGTSDILAWGDDDTKRAIMVLLHDGTQIFRVVTDIEFVIDEDADNAEFTQLNLRDPWPETIELNQIAKISWVPLWRLSSDDLTVEWLTDGVCQIALTMETLERLDEDTV